MQTLCIWLQITVSLFVLLFQGKQFPWSHLPPLPFTIFIPFFPRRSLYLHGKEWDIDIRFRIKLLKFPLQFGQSWTCINYIILCEETSLMWLGRRTDLTHIFFCFVCNNLWDNQPSSSWWTVTDRLLYTCYLLILQFFLMILGEMR